MRSSSLHYFPLAPLFLFVFIVLLGLVLLLIQIGLLGYAYEKIGIRREHVFALLLLSLLGSYVNISVAEIPEREILSGREVEFFGVRHVVPAVEAWPRTVVAVNVGGAILPILLSLYLLVKNRLYVPGLAGVAIVAAVVYWLAYPVRGVGIAVPIFVPPLVAALAAVLLSRQSAPSLAYIAGSLGTLIGGDLMNLGKVQGLGAPVVSIGGAGTFDGIFLTGILAVLLA
ncbi:MAG: DUF1614 domain-containing protein [Candidatus Manganitrophaceae bacterium]|nr:MAG: DUF1614 domain-containing protein [Candidatus Manganitrophaceae bacterium]